MRRWDYAALANNRLHSELDFNAPRDNRLIIQAPANAQKAVDAILGFSFEMQMRAQRRRP
jgi:hypothetical protein